MQTKTRMNVYFDPDLLKKVEALALRRNISKSAVIEAAVASFLSADASERLEAVFARRMDRIGRQIEGMDEDLAILGETLAVHPLLADRHAAVARQRTGIGACQRHGTVRQLSANARPEAGNRRSVPEGGIARRRSAENA
jgi:hypothetical protein